MRRSFGNLAYERTVIGANLYLARDISAKSERGVPTWGRKMVETAITGNSRR
jgi:hypothetical protein